MERTFSVYTNFKFANEYFGHHQGESEEVFTLMTTKVISQLSKHTFLVGKKKIH